MSALTGMWTEVFWVNAAAASAVASTASETSLLTGLADQPTIPSTFFANKPGVMRTISIVAKGVLGTTDAGTHTLLFKAYLNTTQGLTNFAGTAVGVSVAIVSAAGTPLAATQQWELKLDLQCFTPGLGSGATTLSGAGWVDSPTGFATPFKYALQPSTPPTATWTSTIDAAVTQYINLSITHGASSSSNTITMKQMFVVGWN